MSFFKRLFKVGQSEAHAMVDKLEDPIKMTEQGIRDMKENLNESLKAFAEVKALAIRSRKEAANAKAQAKDYEQKAMLLIKRAQDGQLEAAEADRLASEALTKKQDAEQQSLNASKQAADMEARVAKLDTSIKKLRSDISHYENELKTLRARAKVSDATKKVNKQMAQIDSTSTVSMLERMKEKVEKDEALSEAYSDIANESKSLDDEIDNALGGQNLEVSSELEALKAKLKGDKPA